MIIFLIENDLYSIDSNNLVKQLETKFPRTSTLSLTNRNLEYVKNTVSNSKPLLTSKWLIIGNQLKEISVLTMVKNLYDNVLVLRYNNKSKEVEDLMKILKSMSIDFNLVDNVNLSEARLVSYVSSELDLSEADARTLVKRCNHYIPYINESVFALKSLGRQIERKDILNFVVKRSSFNTLSLFNHVIGFKRVSNEVVSRFLYDFRYALKFLKTDLLEKLDDALLVYSLMNEGLLSPSNFKEFTFPRKLKISDYLLKSLILDINKSVSYETLIYTKLAISKIDHFYQLVEICTK